MDIIKELNRIKTDKHKCLGCGYEYNCTIKGCAIINQAIGELEKFKSEFNIAMTQLKGKCWCCKHAQPETIHVLDGAVRNMIICELLYRDLSDLKKICEHWEWNGYVESQEEKI